MQILLRLLAFIIYWIGHQLHPVIKLWNRTKRVKIPKSRSEMLNISAVNLITKLKSREITCEDLLRQYIKRIKEVNPLLNAVIEDRFADAVEEATKADQIIALTKDKDDLFRKYPLFGIPFTVKESCGVEGLSHVVGSQYRRGFKTEQDGVTVSLLRKAGAIPLLASANPEFCASWETTTLTHGRCSNPHDTECTPGGSSGGEGALNGAGASVFGVGSDLCGSVRIPALFTGIFGHKPTGGLVSTEGHFPNIEKPGFDHLLQVGPITRFAEDLPLLLDIMAGKNASKLLDAPEIEDIKIFYMDVGLRISTVPISGSMKKAIEKACNHFTTLGNKVRKIQIDEMNDAIEIVISTLLCFNPPIVHANPIDPEHKTTTMTELKKHFTGKAVHSVQALYFQGLHDFSGLFSAFRDNQYLKKKETLASKLRVELGTNGVLFFPTFHRVAFPHNTSIIHTPGTALPGIFNMIGFPSCHVPMGLNQGGMPIGFQVVAAPYADKNCFKVALELGSVFGGWIPPS